MRGSYRRAPRSSAHSRAFVRSDWPLYFEELNGPRRMETIWDGLANRGMSEGKLEKLFGLNVQRLYGEVLG